MNKGETLEIDLKNMDTNSTSGIKVESRGTDLVVEGASFTMADKEMQELWHSPLNVRPIDRGIEVDYDLDARMASVHGIYEVRDNEVIRHHYSVTQIWGVLLVLIITPVVYVIGKVVIMMFNRREQRAAKG